MPINNLKSSLDRFIVTNAMKKYVDNFDLKSSLDRFIVIKKL